MSNSQKDFRTYIIGTAKPTERLDAINRLGGRIYSKTVSLAFKVHEQKGFWLSDGGLKKYLKFKGYPCQAHSVQAIIDDYCGARRSFFSNKKSNPKAKPPKKTRKFHTFTWRATGISYKRGKLRLSMGKGNREPIWLSIDKKFYKNVPAEISLVYNRTTDKYEFHATYVTQPKRTKAKSGTAVAVDMGEIHPIVAFDGIRSEIYNGREHRSKSRYREKSKGSLNRKLSRCERGSWRWKKLKRAKDRILANMRSQLRDMRHKITSRFVSTCHERKLETIVIGDIKHIRRSINYGKRANQKLHQWAFSQIREMITYKAKAVGISVDTQDEAYTSQTCPSCGHRKKPSRRTYHCSQCKWKGHRDIVGASNILTMYQGLLFNPVVGAVVSPTGVRFNPHLRRLDSWSPFSGLISSKPSKRRQRSTRL
jgi:putative transposase